MDLALFDLEVYSLEDLFAFDRGVEVFDIELAHVMTHLRDSRPLQYPFFSYSLVNDRSMTYVIFKGSKTSNRTSVPVSRPRHTGRNRFLNQTSENNSGIIC